MSLSVWLCQPITLMEWMRLALLCNPTAITEKKKELKENMVI